MEVVSYSWLAASACAPLMAVLSLWTVYIFHTYRRCWRTVDLFLLAIATQELITAFFAFGFAVLSLVNPRSGPPCSFILWGLSATRTFQIATLASLVVDRSLTIRWPYKYRFSVRRNQIRYHIAVLAVISVFVGVAAVFARSPEQDDCSVHPLRWDRKFSIFNICLHGVLLITVLTCCFKVEMHRCRARQRRLHFSTPTLGADCVTGTVSGSSVTSSSSGSTRPLHGAGRQKYHRQYSPEPSSDFRWTAVAVISSVCYLTNHLPFLALNILGTVMPSFWSNWHENVILWLRLTESLIVPLLFYLTDPPQRAALRRAFQRRSGKFTDFGDNGRYRMYVEDALEGQVKPCPFGSVTPVGIITNYRRKEKCEQKHSKKRRCSNTESKRYILTSIDTILNPSHFKNNLNTVVQVKPQPEKRNACSITKHGDMQMDTGTWRDDETHIYASLSDSLSNLSYQSSFPDESVFGLSFRETEEETYGGSFTTVANDDFEFHDTRLGVIDLLMHSNDSSLKPEPVPKLSMSAFKEKTYKPLENKCQLSESDSSLETVQDLVIRIDSLNDSFYGKKHSEFGNCLEKTRHQHNGIIPFHVYRVSAEELCKSALPRSRNSWFSMNDLDRIGDKNDWTNRGELEEAMIAVPEKSESMVSLYEEPGAYDQAKTKSVSESNMFCDKESTEIHPKYSLQEEHFSNEGRLLEALWKNNRSSLVLGRGSHVRKAKKRKTKNRQRYGERSSSRKPLEKLGPDQNGVCYWNKDRHTGPMLIEEYMRPIDALCDSSSHEEKNIQNSEVTINKQ